MLAACRGYQCGSWVSNARLIRFLKLGRMDCNSSLFLVHSSFLSIFKRVRKPVHPRARKCKLHSAFVRNPVHRAMLR
jgi:hypothetical protein